MSNRTAFFMAIIGTLHPVPAAATGIVPVGSATFSGTSNTGSSSTDGSAPCDLPAGCMVGDTAVLTCNALVSRNFTWVAPDGAAVVLAATTYGTLRSAVYAVKLVQADIDAGTVSAPFTALAGSSVPSTVEADVYRAIDSAPIDVVGSTVTGTFPNTHASETVTLPGITTHDAGELVQYAIFTNQPNGYISSTPPTGWTPGASQSAVNGEPALTGYTVQATAGPTGDIAVAVASNLNTMSGAYVGMLFALRAYNPTFRLLGTLPNGTVGTVWNGTLNFAGDYTGTITIDASTGTIPAWMGTPTIDTTAKTVTWSGTPTTAKTESFTPRATASGGQFAVGAVQNVVIAAASTANYFDPAKTSADIVLSSGNSVATRGPAAGNWRSTLGVTSTGAGFKVFEVLVGKVSGTGKDSIGVADASANLSNYVGSDTHGWGYLGSTNGGSFYSGGSAKATSRGTWGTGDIVVCAIDASGNVWFGVNSAWINTGGTSDPVAGTRPCLTGATGTLYASASIFLAGDYLTLRVKSSEFTTPLAAACLAGGFSSLSGL